MLATTLCEILIVIFCLDKQILLIMDPCINMVYQITKKVPVVLAGWTFRFIFGSTSSSNSWLHPPGKGSLTKKQRTIRTITDTGS